MHPANEIRLPIATRHGQFIAHYSENGLAGLDFPSGRDTKSKSADDPIPTQVADWHRTAMAALNRALEGKPPQILPPLDLSAGTDFQQNVWNALRQIRAGQTRSYGEIAKAIGKPDAVRAVGGACGANPIPVFVPCHRVLAANRKIGGFSGGLDWKRMLLEREGVKLN
jgi:methylated-DNA-[protein]-cysteine S-methyltransferase